MTTVIAKIEVLFEVIESIDSATSNNLNIPTLMTELHTHVDKVVRKAGFIRARELDDDPSRRNGGWAYYDTYSFSNDEDCIKVLVNVRSANHPSQPNLESKNRKRTEILQKEAESISKNSSDIDKHVIGTYYKERDWGVQYYIGKGNKYSDPVDSLDKLDVMLIGQLNKLKK